MDASKFIYTQDFQYTEFCNICSVCVGVYNTIVEARQLLPNNENTIRDEFIKFLMDNQYRRAYPYLTNYIFKKEEVENDGRVDIQIITGNTFKDTDAYYNIECKRLDSINTAGTTGLNAEYIKNGMCRFITGYYTSYYGCSGMFGFVVDKIDIHSNTCDSMNALLKKGMKDKDGITIDTRVTMPITNVPAVNDFDYAYISKHETKNGEITLFHLMFDFSDLVNR